MSVRWIKDGEEIGLWRICLILMDHERRNMEAKEGAGEGKKQHKLTE